MKEIRLNGGLIAKVDDEDWEAVSHHRWFAKRQRRKTVPDNWYVFANIKTVDGRKVEVTLHRLIMNPPEGMEVDHIDHDGLNNTRINLRVCTRSQNMRNRRQPPGALPRGVFAIKETDSYGAQLIVRGKKFYNGFTHRTPEDAAKAYDELALRHHGEFATLNHA